MRRNIMAKKKKAPEVTLEQLIAAAEDFNSFMFASPEEGIPLDLEYDDMLAEVTETADELEKTDTILAATAETLDLLDVEFEAQVAEAETEETDEDPEPEEVDEADEKEDAAKAADIALVKKTKDVEKMKTVAKAWKIRIPPPFYKDLAKLRDYLIGKLDDSAPVAEKKVKVDKPVKEKKTKTASKEKKYTRSNALIDALKKFSGGTREEIVNNADVLFTENGGNTNTNVSNYMFGYVMPSLIILGIVSKSDDKYIWNK
jgi:vacuolar-type H+-ATPase subunit I/STV1